MDMDAVMFAYLYLVPHFSRILAELKHPNVVAYHESFFDENEEYLCIIQVFVHNSVIDLMYIEWSRTIYWLVSDVCSHQKYFKTSCPVGAINNCQHLYLWI